MAQIAVINLVAPVAQIARNCPTPTLVQAYVDAVRKFCAKSRWLRTNIAGETVVDQTVYSLGSDPYNEIIGIKAVSLDPDSAETSSLTESQIGFDPHEDADVPEFYRYLPHGNIELHPKPAAVYPLTISAVLQPKRGQNSIDDTLPLQWEYVFQAGALAYLLKIPDQPWTDKVEANTQLAIFMDGCNHGVSSEAAGYNAGAAVTSRAGSPNGRLRSRIQVL